MLLISETEIRRLRARNIFTNSELKDPFTERVDFRLLEP